MSGIGPTGTPQPPQGPDPKGIDPASKPEVNAPQQAEFKGKLGDAPAAADVDKLINSFSNVTPAQVAEVEKDVRLGRSRDEIATHFVARELEKSPAFRADPKMVSQLKDVLLEDKNFARVFNQLLRTVGRGGSASAD